MWLQLTGEKNLYLSPSSRGEQTEMKQFPAADLGLCLSNLSESRSWFLRAKLLQRCSSFAGSSLPLSTLFSSCFLTRQKPARGNKSWEREQEITWKTSSFFWLQAWMQRCFGSHSASHLHLDHQEPSWIIRTLDFSTGNQTGEEKRSRIPSKSGYFSCSAQPANP